MLTKGDLSEPQRSRLERFAALAVWPVARLWRCAVENTFLVFLALAGFIAIDHFIAGILSVLLAVSAMYEVFIAFTFLLVILLSKRTAADTEER